MPPTSPTNAFTFISDSNEGYLTVADPNPLRDMYTALVQSSPFPKILWHKNSTSPDHQGYPCVWHEPNIIRPCQDDPFPKLMLIAGPNTATEEHPEGINQGYPCTYSKVNIVRGVQTYKFPSLMLVLDAKTETVNQGYPCTFSETNVLRGVQDVPFPMLMPSLEDETDGYLCFRHNVKGFGAGSNCIELEELEIPKSVKYITDYAFYNTKIKKVKISSDCMYFRHSFPKGTKIAFYKDD